MTALYGQPLLDCVTSEEPISYHHHTNILTASATSTNNTTTTTRPNCIYMHGVGMLAMLAIGICVLLAYNTTQAKNKKVVNEKQDQPPKQRVML